LGFENSRKRADCSRVTGNTDTGLGDGQGL
jgi:hypothetical protein